MKIGVAIPHKGEIKVKTMLCIIQNIVAMGVDAQVIVTSGSFIHWNREFLYEAAEAQGCTHIVYVDTDMVFPAGAIKQLVDHGKDIIGIVAYKKAFPKFACVRIKEGVEMRPEEIPHELFQCEEVGTGLMAVNLERMKTIPPPHFEANMPLGEDLYFCRKARAAGLEVWCDPTIEVKHIGDFEY